MSDVKKIDVSSSISSMKSAVNSAKKEYSNNSKANVNKETEVEVIEEENLVSSFLADVEDFGSSAFDKIKVFIHLPPGFPEKYENALVEVAKRCLVEKKEKITHEISIVHDPA